MATDSVEVTFVQRLTPNERSLFEILHSNKGLIVLKDDLQIHVWGQKGKYDSLKTTVSTLRKKIAAAPDFQGKIVGKWGRGYRLE